MIYFIIVLFKTPRKDKDLLVSQIIIIDNTNTGRGFAQGVNIGIKKALRFHAKTVFILNPDISISQLSREKLLFPSKYFDIWGFRMNQHNKLYYGGYLEKWRMSSILSTKKPKPRFISCTFVTGSLMGIDTKVFEKIGLFDESYFMYYEDVDFCLRALKANLKIGIDTKYQYIHKEYSTKFSKKEYYLAKNRLRVLFRYGNFIQQLREIIRVPKTILEYRNLLLSTIFRKN